MIGRVVVAVLIGVLAGACSDRDLKPDDVEARAACEALCEQSETCDPKNAMPDCMEQCLIGPYGESNPARWDDRCREETLASLNCQSHLTCEDWLDYLYGDRSEPYTPAQQECLDLGLDAITCRQADDS